MGTAGRHGCPPRRSTAKIPRSRPLRAQRRRRPGGDAPLCCQIKRLVATLDFWDDQSDVYAIKLRRGQPVYLSVRGPAELDTNLILWTPETTRVEDIRQPAIASRSQSAHPGPRENLAYRAQRNPGGTSCRSSSARAARARYKLVIVKA